MLCAPPDLLNPNVSKLEYSAAKPRILETESEELAKLREENAKLKDELSKLQPFQVGDLKLKHIEKYAYYRITTAPGCAYCKPFYTGLKVALEPLNWTFGEEGTHFQLVEITNEEWQRRGITLPYVELVVNGKATESPDRDAVTMSAKLSKLDSEKPTTFGSDQTYGMKIGTIPGRPAVVALLESLEPFLDGGTLTVVYEPKPGVVKEYLTIRQGSTALKIPAKTAIKLQIVGSDSDKQLDITPLGTPIQIVAGPLTRSINKVELTPNRLSIRLPWMVDPEWNIK